VARGKIEAEQAALAILFVVLLEQASNLMRLHPHNGISLRIEIDSAIVNLYADEVFIQLVAIAQECLFGNKFKKPGFFGRVGEVLALQNAAQFFALLEERDWRRSGNVNRDHCRVPTEAAWEGTSRCSKFL
jgi:hypothetical protein